MSTEKQDQPKDWRKELHRLLGLYCWAENGCTANGSEQHIVDFIDKIRAKDRTAYVEDLKSLLYEF
jgi:hypothetical protein